MKVNGTNNLLTELPLTPCERINQFFIGLTSGFVPLSPDDVDSFAVNTSEIPDKLVVSTRESRYRWNFEHHPEAVCIRTRSGYC